MVEAEDGPAFVTRWENVTFWPAATGFGEPVSFTVKSAPPAAVTIVVTVAELLLSCGSAVPEVTEAVSVICVWFGVPPFTWTATVNVLDPALAMKGLVQEIFPEAPTAGVVHDQPKGTVIEWKLVLAGIARSEERRVGKECRSRW